MERGHFLIEFIIMAIPIIIIPIIIAKIGLILLLKKGKVKEKKDKIDDLLSNIKFVFILGMLLLMILSFFDFEINKILYSAILSIFMSVSLLHNEIRKYRYKT